MASVPILRIATLQARFPIVDPKTGIPASDFIDALNQTFDNIETIVNAQADLLNAVVAAQAAADAANAAAAAAQTAADTAQATADAIVVPPSGQRTITADTVVSPDDAFINVDTTAGMVVVTLITASAVPNAVTIKKVSADANVVRIAASGTDTINGAANFDFTTQGEQHPCTNNGLDEWYA